MAGGGAGFGYLALYRPVGLAKPAALDIRPGMKFREIAAQMVARGLAPSAPALLAYARYTGKAGRVKAGEYEVASGMRPIDIIDMLVKGRGKTFWLVVPEGKWVSEISGLIGEQAPAAEAAFVQAVARPDSWQRRVAFPIEGKTLEGYLFPNSYQFSKGAGGRQIVAAMLQSFSEKCWRAYQADPPRDDRTFREVLILASLVEGEAKLDTERAKIAGVYINRLKIGQKLECDATVLYAHGQRLSRVVRPREIDSPYNTYRYPGLPPGPINNPGLASFTAALRPEQTPYYYYVARGDGSHVFSRTYNEHLAAINNIRAK